MKTLAEAHERMTKLQWHYEQCHKAWDKAWFDEDWYRMKVMKHRCDLIRGWMEDLKNENVIISNERGIKHIELYKHNQC
jgi:hypothetical protein